MPDIVVLLLVLVIFVFVAIAVVLGIRSRQMLVSAWQEMAARTGLSFEDRGWFRNPGISGLYRGRMAAFSIFVRRHGRSSTTYMRVTTSVQVVSGAYLQLTRQGFLSKVGEALGAQDVQIGDAAFDEHFIVKSRPESFAIDLFYARDMLRQNLQPLKAHGLRITLEGGMINYQQIGVLREAVALQSLLDLLCDLAEAVEEIGG